MNNSQQSTSPPAVAMLRLLNIATLVFLTLMTTFVIVPHSRQLLVFSRKHFAHFSLRTMLIVTTLVAVVLGFVVWATL